MLSLGINPDTHTNMGNVQLWRYGSNLGVPRKTCEFDGTDDYCLTDHFLDLENISAWTISFWINFDSAPSNADQVFMLGDAVSSDPFLQIGSGTSGGVRHLKQIAWHGASDGTLLDDGEDSIDLSQAAHLNRWIHCMFRWDATVDSGKLQYMFDNCGTFTSSVATHTGTTGELDGDGEEDERLVFGAYYIEALGGPLTEIDGNMAEVAIWNKRLSDLECYEVGAGFNPAGISNSSVLHYWPLSGSGEHYGAGTEADTVAINNTDFNASV